MPISKEYEKIFLSTNTWFGEKTLEIICQLSGVSEIQSEEDSIAALISWIIEANEKFFQDRESLYSELKVSYQKLNPDKEDANIVIPRTVNALIRFLRKILDKGISYKVSRKDIIKIFSELDLRTIEN